MKKNLLNSKVNYYFVKKSKSIKKLGIFFLCLSMLTSSFSFSISSNANEIDQAKEEKKTLEEKKAETERRIKELEKDKSDILKYIEKLDKELNRLAEEIARLEANITDTEVELETARDELEIAKLIEAEQYETMKKRIRYMYENGDSSYLDIIMQSESISDILNHVEYISKITEYDNNLLAQYKEVKEEVIQKELEIQEKLATLNELKENVDYEKSTVELLAEEKNKELVKYQENIDANKAVSSEVSSQIADQEELIEELLEAQRKAEEERRRREEEERKRKEEEERKRREEEAKNNQNSNSNQNQSNSSNTSKPSSTGYIWPVPASSRITSYFGYRNQPTAGASSYHRGIDIGAPTGTPIVATASGRVVTSTYQVAAGNYLMIAHDDGSYSVYMHCSKILAEVGDYVNKGETVALIGSTGVSTGPHLHFGIMVNGQYVNPLNHVSY